MNLEQTVRQALNLQEISQGALARVWQLARPSDRRLKILNDAISDGTISIVGQSA